MSDAVQSFERHARMVPLYHYVATGLLVVPTLWFAWVTVTAFSLGALMTLLFALGVLLVGFFARAFPLGVQDRVIRLEERIRFDRVLSDDLRGRLLEITTDQLIALRFASDEELAELVGRVLEGELRDRKSIKGAIRSWRADHQRI